MHLSKWLWGKLGACAVVLPLVAQDSTVDLLNAAKSHYQAGDYQEAYESLNEAKVAVFQQLPLTLNNFQIVSEPGMAYGVYKAREDNVFHDGDMIFLYCEPQGYAIQQEGDNYLFSLKTDFVILDEEQNVLGSKEDFATFGLESKHPNTELMLNINYKFAGVKPGTYLLQTTIKDTISGKVTTETVPVVFEDEPSNETDSAS